MGGLVHSMDQRLYIALVGFRSDDLVSASLFGRLLVTLVTESTTNRMTVPFEQRDDVQRFDVKDKQVIAFQLESLILAQNERWRQA